VTSVEHQFTGCGLSPGQTLLRSGLGQATYTCVLLSLSSIICSAAEKVIVGLASHRPCITATKSWPKEGRWAPRLGPLMSFAPFTSQSSTEWYWQCVDSFTACHLFLLESDTVIHILAEKCTNITSLHTHGRHTNLFLYRAAQLPIFTKTINRELHNGPNMSHCSSESLDFMVLYKLVFNFNFNSKANQQQHNWNCFSVLYRLLFPQLWYYTDYDVCERPSVPWCQSGDRQWHVVCRNLLQKH